MDPDDLAEMGVQVLRLAAELLLGPLAERDEQMALAVEHQARAEMLGAVELRLLAEDDLDVRERPLVLAEDAAGDRGAVAAVAGLGIAQIHQAVLAEVRVERDVEKAALITRVHLRHARDRLRDLALGRDMAERPRPLGHQHAAVRQKSERPGMAEPVGNGLDVDRGAFGLEVLIDRERGRRREQGDRGRGETYSESGHARFLDLVERYRLAKERTKGSAARRANSQR